MEVSDLDAPDIPRDSMECFSDEGRRESKIFKLIEKAEDLFEKSKTFLAIGAFAALAIYTHSLIAERHSEKKAGQPRYEKLSDEIKPYDANKNGIDRDEFFNVLRDYNLVRK